MTRGEVWWVDEPDAGRRPHLILTREAAVPVLARLVVAPATTKVRGVPTEVPLGREDGMPRDCVLSLDNVTTARKSYFVEWICTLDPVRMRDVCVALASATGCAQ